MCTRNNPTATNGIRAANGLSMEMVRLSSRSTTVRVHHFGRDILFHPGEWHIPFFRFSDQPHMGLHARAWGGWQYYVSVVLSCACLANEPNMAGRTIGGCSGRLGCLQAALPRSDWFVVALSRSHCVIVARCFSFPCFRYNDPLGDVFCCGRKHPFLSSQFPVCTAQG